VLIQVFNLYPPKGHLMARNFIKTLVIATVFVSGVSVSSARAGQNELGEFLAATIFMFAIANALGGDDVVVETQRPNPPAQRPSPNRRVLPKSCIKTFVTQQGSVRTFEKSCLQRQYRYYRRLPESCEQTLWTSKGIRNGYEPSCLRRMGYRARK